MSSKKTIHCSALGSTSGNFINRIIIQQGNQPSCSQKYYWIQLKLIRYEPETIIKSHQQQTVPGCVKSKVVLQIASLQSITIVTWWVFIKGYLHRYSFLIENFKLMGVSRSKLGSAFKKLKKKQKPLSNCIFLMSRHTPPDDWLISLWNIYFFLFFFLNFI